MSADAVLREVTLTLPMSSDMEVQASQSASALARSIAMSPEKVDEVRLAVVEACINAFEHSHADDGRIDITFCVIGRNDEPQALEIRVHDTGIGFSPDTIAEPSIADKLKSNRKRGWGLKIIRGLMDEVQIDSGRHGTTVVMRKLR
jgi:serine/threonine-protein kinase RsbW